MATEIDSLLAGFKNIDSAIDQTLKKMSTFGAAAERALDGIADAGSDVGDALVALGKRGVKTIDAIAGVAEDAGDALVALGKRTMDTIDSMVSKAGEKLGKLKGPIVAGAKAAGSALLDLTARSMESIDTMVRVSESVGITTESLQGYRFAAEQAAGVSSGAFDSAMQQFSQGMAQAAQGTGNLLPMLQQYGISMIDAEGRTRSVDSVFRDYADAVAGAGNSQEQMRMSTAAFGSEGANLVNMLREGSDGLDKYAADAASLGIVVSRFDAAKVVDANNSLDRMGKVFEGVGNKIAVAAAPAIKFFTDLLVDGMTKTGWLTKAIGFMADFAVIAIAATADAWVNLGKIWQTIKWGFGEFILVSLQGLAKLEDAVLSAAKFIPGLDPPDTGPLRKWADEWGETMAGVREDTLAALNVEQPGEGIKESFAQKAEEIEESAAARAAEHVDPVEPVDESGEGGPVEAAAALQQQIEDQAKEHVDRLNQQDAEALAANKALWAAGWRGRMTLTSNVLGQVSTLMESKSKKMFVVGKAAAIGEASIQAILAAQKAYAAFAYFPPLGAAMAAVALAAGLANVQKIKSQKFGGSGVSSGGGGGAGAGAASAPAGVANVPALTTPANQNFAPQVINLTVENDSGVWPTESVIALIDQINDLGGDGQTINMATG